MGSDRELEDRDSTVPDPSEVSGPARARRARWARRSFLALLLGFLAAGGFGVLGPRSSTTTARRDGYVLTVTYASRARPGLAVPFGFEVHRPGGFTGPVTIATSTAYLAAFDQNAIYPEPTSATADGRFVIWEFDPPPGDRLKVRLDVHTKPGTQWGRTGATALLENDREVIRLAYRTQILP